MGTGTTIQQKRQRYLCMLIGVTVPSTVMLVMLRSTFGLVPKELSLQDPSTAEPLPEHFSRVIQTLLPDAYQVVKSGPQGHVGSDTVWDPKYTNPCTTDAHGKTLCVPYFYVLGAFHSGARDLFDRISAHPDVYQPPDRNPYFFSEVHMWDRSLWRGCDFGKCPTRRGIGAEPLPLPPALEGAPQKVVGEVAGGALTFTWALNHQLLHAAWEQNMTDCWKQGNRGPTNYKCFAPGRARQEEWEASVGWTGEGGLRIPWVMRGVHGAAKVRLVAVLRDPAERVHSAFWFWPQYRRKYGPNRDGFLAFVKEQIAAVQRCFDKYDVRRCAMDFESLDKDNEEVYYHADQIFKSLYAAYIPTWHAAFGKERLLVVRAEDYWHDPKGTLVDVFDHLGLPTPSDAEWEEILGRDVSLLVGTEMEGPCGTCGDYSVTNRRVPVEAPEMAGMKNRHSSTRCQEHMLPEARELLDRFFQPFNDQLADLLGHPRFAWRDKVVANMDPPPDAAAEEGITPMEGILNYMNQQG